LGSDGREINAALCKLVDELGPLGRIEPVGTELVRTGTQRPHFLRGVVGELDDAQLFAVGVEFVDQFSRYLHLAGVEVEFPRPLGDRINGDAAIGRLAELFRPRPRAVRVFDLGAGSLAVGIDFLLRGEGWIAIEGRVGKVAGGGAGVVEDV